MEKIVDNIKYEMYRLNISFKDSGHYTNTYILKDKKTNECIVVDPAYNDEYISRCIGNISGNLKIIYLTHCHGDHIAALEKLYNGYDKDSVKILIHENDKYGIFDDDKNCKYILSEPNFEILGMDDILVVKEGDILKIGETKLEILHTPGHTNGSSCIYEKEHGILITGDTLFSDCYGRTDLKSGSTSDMKQSLDKIFSEVEDNVTIFPGHGESCKLSDAKKRVLLMIAFD